jgi:hypothetical protein
VEGFSRDGCRAAAKVVRTMSHNTDYFRRALCDALVVLSLPPDEQVRVNGPGCLSCDLLNDFDIARKDVCEYLAEELSVEQRRLLDEIDALTMAMQEPDYECFNNEVVRRPVWQRLRELATETLRVFGWEQRSVKPFNEVEPGVWFRPPNEG